MDIENFLNQYNFDLLPDVVLKKFDTNSCVLVGNSSKLMDNKFGETINNKSVIIRFNHAPTEGYKEYVGDRTDLRILNAHCINSMSNPVDDEHKRTFTGWNDDFLLSQKNQIFIAKSYLVPNIDVIYKLKSNNTHFALLNPPYYQYESPSHPMTSGLTGLLIALRHFEEVFYTGYDFYKENGNLDENNYSLNTHYFEKVLDYDRSCHNLDFEKNIFESLTVMGRIKQID